ncbi:MAG: preprotein translocase subunit SecA [Gammaproteobacteria bacterium RIFCSPHIGHO2_12_FULL_35_23]|nr:MAG: preprotein translocase subunit SecA [Gammaproteobacteria bacterium RIFCSPHIGHO2_12_FULL_35_23]
MFIRTFIKSIFGSRNERIMKRLSKVVVKINQLEESFKQLSDEALQTKTQEFRDRLARGGESLDALLPEAFATVREAAKRTLGMRHFDVQLIGGMVLHEGNIAEMRTGEGKTLVATLPAYLNALTEKGVHIVTVNDYLAKRDAEWMEPIYKFLGLTVGINLTGMTHPEKQKAYAADITYGTNNEFGFDYLRDNMAFSLEGKVQRSLNYAIVDEVDSILIDEARTPLIISGPSDESSDLYVKINQLVPKLIKRETEEGSGDYYLDEKQKQAYLTEEGHEHIEQLFTEAELLSPQESLYDARNITLMHHLNACLRANTLYHRDVEYIVKGNEVIIIDEHTGRSMIGRRWSDGLHQAVEAKEGVKVQNENQTLASITFQNYFRLYEKLSGMTGTADTEAHEFHQIYNLEVVVIPTNKTSQRKDYPDQIYLTAKGKFECVVNEIIECRKKDQPVLVGTASIETSEYLSKLLRQQGIMHQVLNAKFHEKEAHIIAQAGKPGTVTIATNMAGRGTDIVLGGNLEAELASLEDSTPEKIAAVKTEWQKRHDKVIAAGGLHIIGSERHESRRIDNQLRGRSARQGDPGSTRFFLSLDDTLMRIFASPRVGAIMRKLGLKETDPIEHSIVTKAIENAQRKVEVFHFDIRKQLIEYDDVANDQRRIVYQQRNELLASEHIVDTIEAIREDVLQSLIREYIPEESLEEEWDIQGLEQRLQNDFNVHLELKKMLDADESMHEEGLIKIIDDTFKKIHEEKIALTGEPVMRSFEKTVMLQTLDSHWKEHLAAMDHLRQGIHLRGYAQKNPKQEYKREAFLMFSNMLEAIKYDVLKMLITVQVKAADVEALEEKRRQAAEYEQAAMRFNHAIVNNIAEEVQQSINQVEMPELAKIVPIRREGEKVGRNDPCPCGSGKKYKQCHGKLN